MFSCYFHVTDESKQNNCMDCHSDSLSAKGPRFSTTPLTKDFHPSLEIYLLCGAKLTTSQMLHQ